MKIESAFDVNNIVLHKFQKNNALSIEDKAGIKEVFEIVQIESQTCYGGTQIFYQVRPLHISFINDYKDGKSKIIFKDVSAAHMSGGQEYCKFREDELKPATQDIIDLLLNNN